MSKNILLINVHDIPPTQRVAGLQKQKANLKSKIFIWEF